MDWLENLNGKPWFLPSNMSFPANYPFIQFWKYHNLSHEPAGNGSDQARVAKCSQGEIRKNNLRSTKGYHDSERMWVQTITSQHKRFLL